LYEGNALGSRAGGGDSGRRRGGEEEEVPKCSAFSRSLTSSEHERDVWLHGYAKRCVTAALDRTRRRREVVEEGRARAREWGDVYEGEGIEVRAKASEVAGRDERREEGELRGRGEREQEEDA